MGPDSKIEIDSSHCRAICDEIGEHLRRILDREATALPPRLQLLLERLADQDLVEAPSIAPSIDGMPRPTRARSTTGRPATALRKTFAANSSR